MLDAPRRYRGRCSVWLRARPLVGDPWKPRAHDFPQGRIIREHILLVERPELLTEFRPEQEPEKLPEPWRHHVGRDRVPPVLVGVDEVDRVKRKILRLQRHDIVIRDFPDE